MTPASSAFGQAEYAAPVLEPKTQAFVDAGRGSKPIYTLPYADARKVLEGAQGGPISKQQADVKDVLLPVGAKQQISVRIYRPVEVSGQLPVVMYFHGGGWVLGSKDTHDRLMRDLVNATQKAGTPVAYVFVNYTPSPEAQYPVPIEEAYSATAYVSERGKDLGLDSSRIALAGDSVGGNMTAAVALMAKERKGPALRYQAMFYPVTDAAMNTASYSQFAGGPWLTKPAMAWFWDAYAPKMEDRTKITASPLRATSSDLKDLPPALVITDENDVLRDEGKAYARHLMMAGVETTAVRYLSTIHDFMLLNAVAGTPASKSAIEFAAQKLASALQE